MSVRIHFKTRIQLQTSLAAPFASFSRQRILQIRLLARTDKSHSSALSFAPERGF